MFVKHEGEEERVSYHNKNRDIDDDLNRIISSGFGGSQSPGSSRGQYISDMESQIEKGVKQKSNSLYGGGMMMGGGSFPNNGGNYSPTGGMSRTQPFMQREGEGVIINNNRFTPVENRTKGSNFLTPENTSKIQYLQDDYEDEKPQKKVVRRAKKPKKAVIKEVDEEEEYHEEEDTQAVHSGEDSVSENEGEMDEDESSPGPGPSQKKGGDEPRMKKTKSRPNDLNAPGGTQIRRDKTSRRLVMYPVPKDYGLMRCQIIREKKTLGLYPRFFLYEEGQEGKTFLMAAKKRKNQRTSNFCVCLDRDDLRRDSDSFVGKLRSNLLGTKFYLYDGGENHKNASRSHHVRKQYGAVTYSTNFFGTKGPRKMTAVIPKITSEGKYKSYPDKPGKKLLDRYKKKGDWSDIVIMKNKGPSWNENLKAYVLDFKGRVTKPSVKNFQLVNPHNNDIVLLQFGRVNSTTFSLDFRFPLCPFQAFCIALTSFDLKIACE